MAKINEYPQAAALNDTDLLVMDQVQAGTHSTKSVSIGQIKDEATSGLSGDNIPIEEGSQDSIAEAIGEKATVYEIGDINTSSKTITFSTTVRFLLFSTGGSNARLTAHLCIGRSSTSFTQALLSSSIITVTATNNTITITTTADNTRFHMILLSGSTDDFVIT